MGNTNVAFKGPDDFQPQLLRKSSSVIYGNELFGFLLELLIFF